MYDLLVDKQLPSMLRYRIRTTNVGHALAFGIGMVAITLNLIQTCKCYTI